MASALAERLLKDGRTDLASPRMLPAARKLEANAAASSGNLTREYMRVSSVYMHVRRWLKRVAASAIDVPADDRVADRIPLRHHMIASPRDGRVNVEAGSSERRIGKVGLTEAGEIRVAAAREAWPRTPRGIAAMFGIMRTPPPGAWPRAVVASERSPAHHPAPHSSAP